MAVPAYLLSYLIPIHECTTTQPATQLLFRAQLLLQPRCIPLASCLNPSRLPCLLQRKFRLHSVIQPSSALRCISNLTFTYHLLDHPCAQSHPRIRIIAMHILFPLAQRQQGPRTWPRSHILPLLNMSAPCLPARAPQEKFSLVSNSNTLSPRRPD